MLVVLAVGLVVADLVTTLIGLRIAGPEGETNGFHRRVIVRWGPGVFAIVYLAIAAAVISFTVWIGGLVGMVPVMAVVVANNVFQLLRWARSRGRSRGVGAGPR